MSSDFPGDVARRVVHWQQRAGRHDLPWQGTRDPYRVWLSEVMLQQTQVSTVLAYYPRFLARFADLPSLAAAPLDEVLALWSGLGYYRRARLLHRCARLLMAEHGGVFPSSAAALARLPGIGRSTAAAIAAFCHGERAAILDGNVKRVLTRVLGFGHDLALPARQRELWALADALLPEHDIEAYTQGLMDLGAMVCLARSPRCEACPLRTVCVARGEGRPEAYPLKPKRKARGCRAHALLWLQQGQRWWLAQRPATGVWAGLWSFPEFPSPDDLQAVVARWPGQGEWLPPIQHALTHFDWTLQPLCWRLPAGLPARERKPIEATLGAGTWHTADEALARGLPAPVRAWLQAR